MKNYIIYKPTVNRAKSIGVGTRIGAFCDLGKDVEIGKNCNIQAHVTISNGCKIGNNVFIGPNTSLLNDKYMDGGVQIVVVEDNAKVGGGVIILPGVFITKGMIVGAGSVVTKTFTKHSMIMGNPAKVVIK